MPFGFLLMGQKRHVALPKQPPWPARNDALGVSLGKHLIPRSGENPSDLPAGTACSALDEAGLSLLRPSSEPRTPVSAMDTQGQAVAPPKTGFRGSDAREGVAS